MRGAQRRRSRTRSATMARRRPLATTSPLLHGGRDFPSSATMDLHGVRHMRGASGVLPRRLRLPHAPALASGCVVVPLHDMKWTCFAPSRARCLSVCYAIERHARATYPLCCIGCLDSAGCLFSPCSGETLSHCFTALGTS
jgi:hypothetical protein